jgi:hypothetical protein
VKRTWLEGPAERQHARLAIEIVPDGEDAMMTLRPGPFDDVGATYGVFQFDQARRRAG